MDKKIFLYIFSFLAILIQSAFGMNDCSNEPNDLFFALQSQGYALHIPAGASTSGILSQDLNSNTAIVGQAVNVILTNDFICNNQLVAPSGSIVSGSIVFNKKAGMAGKSAQMQIRFTLIRTPFNNVIPVSAVVATNDLSGILQGGSNIESSGATLNGGLGVAKSLTTRGNSILIPANTRIKLLFDQPITLGAT